MPLVHRLDLYALRLARPGREESAREVVCERLMIHT